MAAAKLEFDPDLGIRIKDIFPELPLTPEWLAQAWSLDARFARPYKPKPARNELTFLLFILGLKVGWPMHTPFSQEVWELAMKDGTARAQQILMIVFIFHEKSGSLPQLNIC
ncbi:hypothetical protein [Cupriavidus basilensis]